MVYGPTLRIEEVDPTGTSGRGAGAGAGAAAAAAAAAATATARRNEAAQTAETAD